MSAAVKQTPAQEKAAIERATKAALALADKDLAAPLHVFHGFLPQAVRDIAKSCCKSDVDAPIAILCFELVVACLASATVVVATNAHWAAVIAHFVILYALYAERYILMLHFSEHRRVYNSGWMDQIAPSFIAPFFGIPPFLYRLHHVYMHHVENNGVGDLSSTEDYSRGRISEFIRYWLRFWAAAWVSLPFWATKNKRQDVLVQAVPYLAAWAVALSVLPVNAVCFRWLFVVPHCVTFFLLAFGNWSQHVFVNPDIHRENPGLAYDVVGSDFNQRVFNDGYHLVHHAHSRAHWSDLPNRFKAGIDMRREKDALAFHSIDFFMVGVYGTWWPGQGGLRRLARNHYVFFGQPSAKLSNCKCATPEVVDDAYCVNCVVNELERRRVAIKPKAA